MTGDLKHLLAQLRIEKCILIGHSMGGKTAMTTALTQVSSREMSPWIYHDATVPSLDFTWPFSLHSPILSELNNPPLVFIPHLVVLVPFCHRFSPHDIIFYPSSLTCLPQSVFFFAAWFSGEVGGSGHQSSPDHHTHQLPLLHPGHAGGEDLQWHPTLHRQADGWGSAAQFGQGQDCFLIQYLGPWQLFFNKLILGYKFPFFHKAIFILLGVHLIFLGK